VIMSRSPNIGGTCPPCPIGIDAPAKLPMKYFRFLELRYRRSNQRKISKFYAEYGWTYKVAVLGENLQYR